MSIIKHLGFGVDNVVNVLVVFLTVARNLRFGAGVQTPLHDGFSILQEVHTTRTSDCAAYHQLINCKLVNIDGAYETIHCYMIKRMNSLSMLF